MRCLILMVAIAGTAAYLTARWAMLQNQMGPAAGPNYARAWKRQFAGRLHAASLFASLAMNDHSRAAAAQLIRAFPSILTWGAMLSGKAASVMSPPGSETGIAVPPDDA